MDVPTESSLQEEQIAALAVERAPTGTSPAWMLKCEVAAAPELLRFRFAILRATGQTESYFALAGQSASPRSYKFTTLGSEEEVAAYLVQGFGMKMRDSTGDARAFVVDQDGYVALLAVSDVMQAARLRSQLARLPSARPVLNADVLQREWDRSASQNDMRWAGVAGVRACPAGIDRGSGQIQRGVASLRKAGVLYPMQRGDGLTEMGDRMIAILSRLGTTATLTASALRDRRWTAVGYVSAFASEDDACLARWAPAGDVPTVQFVWLGPTSAREAMRSLLQTKSDNRAVSGGLVCQQCGSPLRSPQSKFCTNCGAPVAAASGGTTTAHEALRRCPNLACGKPVAADKKFCTNCGTRMPAAG